MNKNYNLKLDLQFRCNNSTMKFNQFDNNTSDFFMKISNGGKSFDIEKAIVVLAVIKPSGKVASQFVEVKNDIIYADLKSSMKDEIGTYTAKAMLILEDERVVTDPISYEVEEDKIFSLLNDSAEDTEEFTLLTDMLSRLSTIESSEEQRIVNEAERILSEENRKIEEADRTKYDAIRESNENIRKQNESIRLANETNRIDEESKRVEEENKRKLAEEERNANYNFMTEDEERRRSEANAHKEAEVSRVQAETDRVNEEAKRRTTEQARVSAENIRVGNENTREANEVVRRNNETQRVEAETQRQSRYNSFISDAEANANNFENYTNTAKAKEEERKSNELDRKSQEDRRTSNENERISNENSRKANELVREENETSRQNIFENKVDEVDEKIVELNTTKDNFVSSINTKVDNKISEIEVAKSDMTTTVSNKVNEVETRFNALTSSQQQDAEVIDARDGETSLKARLDRDIEKAKQVYVNVEGNHISTDSSVGYAKDVEILGNTIQDASNLADIRSVGDKVEGQELYEIPVLIRGKNLFNGELEIGGIDSKGMNYNSEQNCLRSDFIRIYEDCVAIRYDSNVGVYIYHYDINYTYLGYSSWSSGTNKVTNLSEYPSTKYIRLKFINTTDINIKTALYSVADTREYEPYIEDKLTILSPVQLEKVGDVADRIIEKDGVWGVEKNVKSRLLGNENWYYDSNLKRFQVKLDDVQSLAFGKLISNAYIYANDGREDKNMMTHLSNIYIIEHSCTTSDEFNKHLRDNNVFIKYATNAPQFIPLPHDQQIKLRTFANKTNISFLTEIEGTIKAQVPKSLGATVNTHTEQINNLNNELNRVKKLEESTVSTVTTESDFTTVEATSNGYFEDVKLEGKTLVNLWGNKSSDFSLNGQMTFNEDTQFAEITTTENRFSNIFTKNVTLLKPNTLYTVVVDVEKNTFPSETRPIRVSSTDSNLNNIAFGNHLIDINGGKVGKFIYKLTTIDDLSSATCGLRTYIDNSTQEVGLVAKFRITILEGDHTQNPPSYFEGLKSVGDGADEIVVSSCNNGNLFDGNMSLGYLNYAGLISPHQTWVVSDFIDIQGVPQLNFESTVFNGLKSIGMYDSNKKLVNYTFDVQTTVEIGKTVKYVRIGMCKNPEVAPTQYELENPGITMYINLKTDKKYQSDKKRLLYYNEETQTWEKPILRQWDSIEKHADGKYYYHVRSVEEDYTEGDETVSDYITDMTTTVKPLAQEKVYECTNIDLITYANETNYVIESGVLSPRTTLKVHNNISNVVSLLQKKVSLLESNVKASQEVQDMMILETDMRMLDIELALMEFMPMTLNLGGSNMLRSATYFNFLKNHIINETYEKEYLENVMNKYLATGRINQDEYNELYKMLYPPVYDIELPIEY